MKYVIMYITTVRNPNHDAPTGLILLLSTLDAISITTTDIFEDYMDDSTASPQCDLVSLN